VSPGGVVAREDGKPVRDAVPLRLPHPPQHPPDRQREQRDAVPIGRGSTPPPLIPTRRPLAPEVVPRRSLVPTQRPQPVGEAHEHDTPGPRHPQHLPQHAPRIRHMLQHIGREADVHRPIPHRQRPRVTTHITDRPQIHRHVPRPRRPESRRKEPRPAAHIQHTHPAHRHMPPHQRHRVGRQRPVEGRRIHLLTPTSPHQPNSAPHPEVPPPNLLANHASTVATPKPAPATPRRNSRLRHPWPPPCGGWLRAAGRSRAPGPMRVASCPIHTLVRHTRAWHVPARHALVCAAFPHHADTCRVPASRQHVPRSRITPTRATFPHHANTCHVPARRVLVRRAHVAAFACVTCS
jgi:hypothetical protein